MRPATFAVIMIAVFLSLASASAGAHDEAIGVELTVISGVMVRTADKWTYQITEDTKLLVKFTWDDRGYREEPTYATSAKTVIGINLKKIRLAEECELVLELTGRNAGADILRVSVGGDETTLAFQVR